MTDDRLQGLALLREVERINARTVRELGPLPSGGLPVQLKRKPALHKPIQPMATATQPPSDEEPPMEMTRLTTTAVLTVAASLSACAADDGAQHAAAQGQPVSTATVQPTPSAATEPTASNTRVDEPEPEYGAPIPAAELRKRILTLAKSFQSLEHLEHQHVENTLMLPLKRSADYREGYEYAGKTAEGWQYSVSVAKLGPLKDPSTIKIGMDYGFDYDNDRPPLYCTLEFEPLAKELVAMGYEQAGGPYRSKGDSTWWFRKPTEPKSTSVAIGVGLYALAGDGVQPRTCIQSLRIGGNKADE
jgi:hypothetical protein